MAPCLDAVESRLRDAGCTYELLDHRPAMTTQEAAGAGGVSGYSFAKAVMVMVDGWPQLHVLRAADSVDLDSVRAIQGARDVRVAREGEFEHLVPGCDAGSPPPIPLVADLPVRVDRRLLDSHLVTFEVGDATHSIRMSMADYLRVVPHQVGDFAEAPAQGRRRPLPRPFAWGTWARRAAIGAGALFSLILGPRMAGKILPNRTSRTLALGAAGGAVAAALADPQNGSRRRHILWDRAGALTRRANWWTRKKIRYYRGRSEGMRHNLQEMQDAMPGG